MVVMDPAWKEQEDEDVLLDGGALCSSVSAFQAGWSSFSFSRSIGIKDAGMLRQESELGVLIFVGFMMRLFWNKGYGAQAGDWKDSGLANKSDLCFFWFISFFVSFRNILLGRLKYEDNLDGTDAFGFTARNENSRYGKQL